MKKISILYIILISACNIVFSQSNKISKGDKNYNKFSYQRAIKYYQSVSDKDLSAASLRNLAHCYHMTGNDAVALTTYEKVVNHTESNFKDFEKLAYYQRLNQKYDAANKSLEDFIAKGGSGEIRAIDFIQNKSKQTDWKTDRGNAILKNLNLNSAAQEFGVAYFNNEVIFVSSNASVGPVKRIWNGNNMSFLNIYAATPKDGELDSIRLFKFCQVNRKYHDGPACFASDGKLMIFTRNNYNQKASDKTVNLELYSSELKNNEWSDATPFPYNNKEYSVGHPSLTSDGKTLYFSSNMQGSMGGTDIFRCNQKADGSWDKPENLGDKINTEGNEMFPYINDEGLLFFASDGRLGLGGLDIFASQVSGSGFRNPVNLSSPINSEKDDFAFVINKTQKSGYLSSNRTSGKGDDDIYSFTLKNPIRFGKVIRGIAYDKSGPVLPGTIINLTDGSGNKITTITVGENGAYEFDADDNKNYQLIGTKENYLGANESVNTQGSESIIQKDLYLQKDPGFNLLMLITDKKTSQPLENVEISYTSNPDKKITETITPATGDMRVLLQDKKLNDEINYSFMLKKEGYLTKEFTYSKKLTRPGEYRIHEEMDITMSKIEVGADLAEILKINPIYFDLNKFEIRKDASVELEKIIKVMNENPTIEIELGSHTDCRSSIAYNQKLSLNRAMASAEYIKQRITRPERIFGKGYGESKLKNGCACEGAVKSNCSEAEHQLNRRTEFVIVKM